MELISKAFGYENWNVLSAKIEAANATSTDERSPPPIEEPRNSASSTTLYCSFCGKSQHEVRKLIKGPAVLICDECVDLCTGIVEPDDDKELFRLMKGTEENEARSGPVMLDLARRASTEELAHYVERGRKGIERNRVALDGIQRRLDAGDYIPPGNTRDWLTSKTREEIIVLQQKAQRELRQYEVVLRVATAVLSERRQ